MTTNELHELARNPFDFDTKLARIHADRERHQAGIAKMRDELHRLAGDRKRYRNTREPVWGMGRNEVIQDVRLMAADGNDDARTALYVMAGDQAIVEALSATINLMDTIYQRQGNRWTRFFPSVTKSQPHIHRSLYCRTLHATTVMTWAPALSGKTDEQAVAELDEALCSVCFPDAPVALHNYVSKRSQAEQAQRQAEKDTRNAARAAKTLADSERFRTRYGRDQVTTVHACKEIIRKLVESEVELEWANLAATAASYQGDIERLRANMASRIAELAWDAERATVVLIDREQAHPGWGLDAAGIDKMMINKRKAARKEWGL